MVHYGVPWTVGHLKQGRISELDCKKCGYTGVTYICGGDDTIGCKEMFCKQCLHRHSECELGK